MPHAYDHSETARRDQDGGRAGRAWRWFSEGTILAASHFRDWSARRLMGYAAASAGVIVASRLDPGHAAAPWLFMAGLAAGAWTLRAVTLKLIDEVWRRARD